MLQRAIPILLNSLCKSRLNRLLLHQIQPKQHLSSSYRFRSLTTTFCANSHNSQSKPKDIPMPVNTTSRISHLRELMAKEGVDVYVVKAEDAHSSEYVSSTDKRREFISGFSGSAGTAVITKNEGLLFTDGRYFLQASIELDQNWKLMKILPTDPVNWTDYLNKSLPKGSKVGFDPLTFTIGDVRTVNSSDITLVPIAENLVDMVWSSTRPPRPSNAIVALSDKISGQTWQSKIDELKERIKAAGAVACFVTKLDEVAWLFNLRGSDVEFNPVFFSYALVTLSGPPTLFVQKAGLGQATTSHLGSEATIQPYEDVVSILKTYSKTLGPNEKVLFDSTTSFAVWKAFEDPNRLLSSSQIEVPKAIKNETELEGFRQCHIRDGAGLVSYFAWLEEELLAGKKITESQGSDELERIRSGQKGFRGLSFPTISSTGSNAAIIHYFPSPPTCPNIDPSKIYLCDSGAQYLDGTTDVTRTIHFKEPTSFEKRAFTRVLQGHIEIAHAIWPEGLTGYRLDTLARKWLWKDGLDYRHGTGHGVGHYLNVHEGPAGIGFKKVFDTVPLLPGMVLSNEPGFYKDGDFGIRIENLVTVKVVTTPHANDFDASQRWLGLETLTFCPIQTKLMDVKLMSSDEINWVNEYHKECWEKLKPELEIMGDNRGIQWLKRETASI